MRVGSLLSLIFHVAIVLLLIFGLPDLFASEEMVAEPVPVQLATLADLTTVPKPADSPKPSIKPADTPPPPAPQAPPTPTPPAPPTPPQAEQKPPQPQVATTQPPPAPPTPPQPQPAEVLPDLPQPEVIPDKTQEQPPPQEAKVETPPLPQLRPPQPDESKQKPAKKPTQQAADFNTLLKNLTAQQTAETGQAPPQPPQENQSAAPQSAIGPQMTSSELDALRSQISNHWNVDPGRKDAAGIVVVIRVTAGPDGAVIGMPQIEDTARLATDPVYRSIAESARRAILLSSPLKLPPGKYDVWRGDGGLVLRFSPQGML
jgi:outer membrane biosynthesis protein TonB